MTTYFDYLNAEKVSLAQLEVLERACQEAKISPITLAAYVITKEIKETVASLDKEQWHKDLSSEEKLVIQQELEFEQYNERILEDAQVILAKLEK